MLDNNRNGTRTGAGANFLHPQNQQQNNIPPEFSNFYSSQSDISAIQADRHSTNMANPNTIPSQFSTDPQNFLQSRNPNANSNNQKGHHIFMPPKNNLDLSNEQLSPILKPGAQKNIKNQEQEIYEPSLNNITVIIDDEEVLSLERGIINQNPRSGNQHDYHNSPQNINRNQEIPRYLSPLKQVQASYMKSPEQVQVSAQQTKAPVQSQIPVRSSPLAIPASKSAEWPPLISNLKQKETGLPTELDYIFKINQDHLLENHFQKMRKKVLDKLEIGLDTVMTIGKETEEIRISVQQKYQEINENEFIFTGDKTNKKLDSFGKIHAASDIIQGQQSATSGIFYKIKKQISLCQPIQPLAACPRDFVLENWVLAKVQGLKAMRVKFDTIYSEQAVKEMIVKGTTNDYKSLSQQHAFLIPRERLQFLKEFGNRQKKEYLVSQGDFLLFLVEVDQNLILTSQQSEGAVRQYNSFLEIEKEDTELALLNLNICNDVIKMSSNEITELNTITPVYQEVLHQGELLGESLETDVKSPFANHKKENIEVLTQAEDKRIQYIQELNKFLINTSNKRKKIINYQQSQGLPFIIQNPFDWEIAHHQSHAEQGKKYLEDLGVVIKNLKNLGPTSEQAESIYQSVKEEDQKNQQHSSQQEIDFLLMKIHNDVDTLVSLKDSLGINTIKYSKSSQIHPLLREEEDRITQILQETQQFEDKVFLMKPSAVPSNMLAQSKRPIFDKSTPRKPNTFDSKQGTKEVQQFMLQKDKGDDINEYPNVDEERIKKGKQKKEEEYDEEEYEEPEQNLEYDVERTIKLLAGDLPEFKKSVAKSQMASQSKSQYKH